MFVDAQRFHIHATGMRALYLLSYNIHTRDVKLIGLASLSFACVILTCLLTSAVLLHVCAVGESSLELLSQRRLSPFFYRVLNAALAPSPVGGLTRRHATRAGVAQQRIDVFTDLYFSYSPWHNPGSALLWTTSRGPCHGRCVLDAWCMLSLWSSATT